MRQAPLDFSIAMGGEWDPCAEAREHATLDAMHGVGVVRPSTVAEHTTVTAQDEETANAPGRPEGRCEHADLAIT